MFRARLSAYESTLSSSLKALDKLDLSFRHRLSEVNSLSSFTPLILWVGHELSGATPNGVNVPTTKLTSTASI